MIEIRKTHEFNDWFRALKNKQAKARILARLRNVSLGNFGVVEPAGNGVSELKIDLGPGYRIYFVKKANTIVFLLYGGDKSSQRKDIEKAHALAKKLKG